MGPRCRTEDRHAKCTSAREFRRCPGSGGNESFNQSLERQQAGWPISSNSRTHVRDASTRGILRGTSSKNTRPPEKPARRRELRLRRRPGIPARQRHVHKERRAVFENVPSPSGATMSSTPPKVLRSWSNDEGASKHNPTDIKEDMSSSRCRVVNEEMISRSGPSRSIRLPRRASVARAVWS